MQFKPKKRLGQNFLIDGNIRRKIVSSCELASADTVLEIGAGRGELTRLLIDHAGKVHSLEVDRELAPRLKSELAEKKNLKVIEQDILKLNLNTHFRGLKKRIKVIGNIPYYITTPIIEHLLKYSAKIDIVFITVQKEFAERVVAVPGSKAYGSLSCFLQYYSEPEILFTISRTCFFPAPKVDSAFLRLIFRRRPLMPVKDEEWLFRIIRAAFNQRRKILKNSLDGVVPAEKLADFFPRYGIDSNARPESLSLGNFIDLANCSLP